jgi:hypothetical protein
MTKGRFILSVNYEIKHSFPAACPFPIPFEKVKDELRETASLMGVISK